MKDTTILKVNANEDFTVDVLFSDGFKKRVDFSHVLHQESDITKPLKRFDYFKRVSILEGGKGITWPNEYDACPDWLRYHA